MPSPDCSAVTFQCSQQVLQGLTNIGNIVVIILALVTTGPLNDWWIVWMARRNEGIYEPEYRLPFMLTMLFGIFGYAGWAIGNDRHMPWIGAVACLAYVLPYCSLTPVCPQSSCLPVLTIQLRYHIHPILTLISPPSPCTCTTG